MVTRRTFCPGIAWSSATGAGRLHPVVAISAATIGKNRKARRERKATLSLRALRSPRFFPDTLFLRERDRQQQRVLRALPGVGRVEVLGERVRVAAAAAAANGDRRHAERH